MSEVDRLKSKHTNWINEKTYIMTRRTVLIRVAQHKLCITQGAFLPRKVFFLVDFIYQRREKHQVNTLTDGRPPLCFLSPLILCQVNL